MPATGRRKRSPLRREPAALERSTPALRQTLAPANRAPRLPPNSERGPRNKKSRTVQSIVANATNQRRRSSPSAQAGENGKNPGVNKSFQGFAGRSSERSDGKESCTNRPSTLRISTTPPLFSPPCVSATFSAPKKSFSFNSSLLVKPSSKQPSSSNETAPSPHSLPPSSSSSYRAPSSPPAAPSVRRPEG